MIIDKPTVAPNKPSATGEWISTKKSERPRIIARRTVVLKSQTTSDKVVL